MKLKEFFDRRSKWCQGHMAIDSIGLSCPIYCVDACAFCLLGALFYLRVDADKITEIRDKILEVSGAKTLTLFNDGCESFEEFKRVLEEANV